MCRPPWRARRDVAGTGAGQIRRILDFKLDDALNGSGWFTIERPFDVPLQPAHSPVPAAAGGASLIACIPFRGRDIFYGNHFEDTGAHQLYGIGLDTITAANTAARFGGFKAWGQGRTGGNPPPQGVEAFYANPNIRNEWIGNRVLEGLRADHQGGSINVSGSFGDAVMNNGNAFEVVTMWGPSWDHDCSPAMFGPNPGIGPITCNGMNRLLTFRRNSIDSNGGFQIGASTDVLLEANVVRGTPGPSVGLQGASAADSPFQIALSALGCINRSNVRG
jgi:hypothetical protein